MVVPPKSLATGVTNSVRVTVRDLDKLGTILDRVVTVGSNRIGGIQFGLQEPEKALDDARRDANAQCP